MAVTMIYLVCERYTNLMYRHTHLPRLGVVQSADVTGLQSERLAALRAMPPDAQAVGCDRPGYEGLRPECSTLHPELLCGEWEWGSCGSAILDLSSVLPFWSGRCGRAGLIATRIMAARSALIRNEYLRVKASRGRYRS